MNIEKRIAILGAVLEIFFAFVIINFFIISNNKSYAKMASVSQSSIIEFDTGNGNIYDCNFKPLVNETYEYINLAIPYLTNDDYILSVAKNPEEIIEKEKLSTPYIFTSDIYISQYDGVYSFKSPIRYSENQIAQHLIGYTSQNEGVSGLEYAYDNILRSVQNYNSVEYKVDGFGNLLVGEDINAITQPDNKTGIVTTIDKDIQTICENIGENIEKGAVMVTEVKTGNILAMASFPSYSVYDLETALNNEDSPLINRNLYSYNLGSIFKLVTAFEAFNENLDGFEYECTGSIDINGQIYKCHDLDGHGTQNLEQAITNSCNTFFIALSMNLDIESFRNSAYTLGFGRETQLASSIVGSSGVLPQTDDLELIGELANFSFGQGMLTATPLQVSQLTCAIANDGNMPILKLVKGYTIDKTTIQDAKPPQYAYTMDEETAIKLQYLMSCAINKNENSNAKPSNTYAAGKTSTAQTGRYDENGEEIYNAWITGFFPITDPTYAVTVLVEDGGYGNDSAAPIFKEIIERIVEL